MNDNIKICFSEIISGYTPCFHKKYGDFFIKHFSVYDICEIDQLYNKLYKKSLEEEIPSLAQRETEILDSELWTKEKNQRIDELGSFIKNLNITKSKLISDIEIKAVTKQIEQSETELNNLLKDKQILIGITAENYSSKKANEKYIQKSLYVTQDLKTRLFNDSEYDELEEYEITDLIKIYNLEIGKFSEKLIKQLSLNPIFTNLLHLSNDNAFNFYGKPITQLTNYQSDLFLYGRYFKDILQNSKNVPPEVSQDPDKLIEWFNKSSTANQLIQTTEGQLDKQGKSSAVQGSVGVVGVSAEKLKTMTGKEDFSSILAKKAKELGRALTMEEIIKLQTDQ